MSDKLKPCPFCGGEACIEDDLVALYEPLGFTFIDNDGHMVLPKKQ